MKKLITLMSFVIIAAAQADYINPSSDWSEIVSTPNVTVNDPIARFGDYAHSHGFLNTCKKDDFIRTIEPISYCESYVTHPATKENVQELECVRYGKRLVRLPLSYETEVCTDLEDLGSDKGLGECINWEKKTFKQSLHFEIPVLGDVGNAASKKLLFKKSFDVPDCK